MAEIAVKVIDPGGYRFAQLVDDDQAVRRIIPLFVERLGLPAELRYQIIASATGRALHPDSTLAGAEVRPGAELVLQPVRDSLFDALINKLYDEAKSYVRDKLWDLAKQRLKALLRLDPEYPDRDGLQRKIPGGSGPAPEPPPLVVHPVESAAPPASSSSAGCWVIVVIALVVAAVYWKPWELVNKKFGGPNPNGVQPAPPVNNPPVQLGTGDVQVTLSWKNSADLDLYVVSPYVENDGKKEQIWYANRINTRSGGQLDVDANGGCVNMMRDPVENVFWPAGRAPRGDYQVFVHYFKECNGSGPTNYELTVRLAGQAPRIVTGTAARVGERKMAVSFRY